MKRRILWIGAALLLAVFAYAAGGAEQELADFEVVVKANSGGAELRCNKGCAWTELSFSCAEADACVGIVDELGVRGANGDSP